MLSCVELGTFVKWLDRIFAAIDVAAPIDERDFPRDQSIPRIQRLRWLRGQRPRLEDNSTGFPRLSERRQSNASSSMGGGGDADELDEDGDGDGGDDTAGGGNRPGSTIAEDDEDREEGGEGNPAGFAGPPVPQQHPIMSRLSTTSYPNEHVDPDTGKWAPRHKWTVTHDQLYAKLCFAVLLFKSPRKSNYVVAKGKRWYVDWDSGRMIRVLPPAYGEQDLWGPWQVISPENRLI